MEIGESGFDLEIGSDPRFDAVLVWEGSGACPKQVLSDAGSEQDEEVSVEPTSW